MKKILIIGIFILMCSLSLSAGQSDSLAYDQNTEQSIQETEPPQSSKVILYSMTAVGVILLALSFRNSKWGRRNR